MHRYGGLRVQLVAAVMVAACTSTPTPSPTGTAAPVAPTAVPRPRASASLKLPAASLMASPTTETSATPTTRPTSTPLPSAVVIEGFGRLTPIFDDDFRDIISGWFVGGTEAGSVAYNEGALQFEALRADGWSTWSGRSTLRPRSVLRVEGSFLPPADGAFGPICADDEGGFLAGVLTTDGGWLLMKGDGEGALEVASDLDAGLQYKGGEPVELTLDCAGAATGQSRIRFSLHRVVIALHTVDGGPETFTYAGVYSEAFDLPHRMRVEHVTAFAGTEE